MRTAAIVPVLAAVFALGCAEVGSSNPYDPATPAAQQAAGVLSGALVLPGEFAADVFTLFRVELRGRGETRETDVGDDGRFAFEAVLAGDYRLLFRAPGFRADAVQLTLAIGESRDVGGVPLALNEGVVTGVARLSGSAMGGHRDILVEALGTPFSTRTGADGGFRLEVTVGHHDIRFSAPGYAPVVVPIEVPEDEPLALEEAILLVGEPATLRGRVTLPEAFDPALADGAEVTLATDDGEAARVQPTDGVFVFPDLQPATYTVQAGLDGFVPASETRRLRSGEDLDLGRLVLAPVQVDAVAPSGVVGTVLRQGAPDGQHGGIRVEAVGTPYAAATTSAGRFELRMPPARYDLRFRAAGYDEGTRDGVAVVDGEIAELPEPIVLAGQPGTVRGELGFEPGIEDRDRLAAARVSLHPAPEDDGGEDDGGEDDGGEDNAVAETNAMRDGTFLLAGVPAGRYELRVEADGVWPERRAVRVAVGEATEVAPIELRSLPQDGVIQGTAQLLGAGPAGHGGISVEAVGTAFATQTLSDGAYTLPVAVSDEGYTLLITHPGYAPARVEVGAVAAEPDVEAPDAVLVGQPGRILGRVRLPDGFGADLLDQVVLELTDLTGEAEVRVGQIAADGRFEFGPVPASEYTVEASLPGFLADSEQASVGPGAVLNVGDLRLVEQRDPDSVSTIVGTARRDCGLDLCDHGGIRVEVVDRPFLSQTNSEGAFSVSVVQGTYDLRFSTPGYQPYFVRGVEVDAGQEHPLPPDPPVVLRFDPATLTGRVVRTALDGTRVAAAGASVSARATDAPQVTPVAPEDGAFSIAGLRAGLYRVEATLEGHLPASVSIQVPAGARFELGDLVLEPELGGLRGVVTLEGSLEHAGTVVTLGGGARQVVTDGGGGWRLDGVPPGTYDLRFENPDYTPGEVLDVVVEHDRVTDAGAHRLTARPGGFRGTFRKAGLLDHAGISVTVAGRNGVTDGDGLVVLEDVPAGPAEVTAVAAGYVPYAGAVRVPANAEAVLPLPVELVAVRGEVAGQVLMERVSDRTGATVRLLGTELATTSAADGRYTLRAPVGNYEGVEVVHRLFAPRTWRDAITVTEAGVANVANLALEQVANDVRGVVELVGEAEHGAAEVRVQAVDGPYDAAVRADADGRWTLQGVPLGEYLVTARHADDPLWEEVTRGIRVEAGDPHVELPIALRRVFLQINGGAEVVTDPVVQLELGARGAVQMRIGAAPGEGDFEPFARERIFELPQQGENTVWATFRNEAGEDFATVTAEVLLDSVAEIASITEDSGGARLSRGDTVHVRLDAGEPGGRASADIVGYQPGIRLFDDGLFGDAAAGDGIYERDVTLVLGADVVDAPVRGHFTDAYGNQAAPLDTQTRVTVGTAPIVSGIRVEPSAAANGARIRWETDEPTTARLEYGETAAYGEAVDIAQPALRHDVDLAGLTRGELYHFRIIATDLAGNRTEGRDRSFAVAPEITVGVVAVAGDGEVYVVWSPNTTRNLVGYNVYRTLAPGEGHQRLNAEPLGDTSYVDQAVQNGTTYHYAVTAVDTFGLESPLSNEVEATPTDVAGGQEVRGIIDRNTVWSRAGNPWRVTGDIVVVEGATLFVLPGTVVEFQGAHRLRVEGALRVEGRPEARVGMAAAEGSQWRGIELIEGARGSRFNGEGVFQGGTVLRHVDLAGAGANGTPWIRLERELGLLLEGVAAASCEAGCVEAEDLGLDGRLVLRGGAWSGGEIRLQGGRLELEDVELEEITIEHLEGVARGRIVGSTLTNADVTLSRGLEMGGNTWTGGALVFRADGTHLDGVNPSVDDTFVGTSVDLAEVVFEGLSATDATLRLSHHSSVRGGVLVRTALHGAGADMRDGALGPCTYLDEDDPRPARDLRDASVVTLDGVRLEDSCVGAYAADVRDSTFVGDSPLRILAWGIVRGNEMGANRIEIREWGLVEENTLAFPAEDPEPEARVGISLGGGLVRGNTLSRASIAFTASERGEAVGNTVTDPPGVGIDFRRAWLVAVDNTVRGAAVGMRVGRQGAYQYVTGWGNRLVDGDVGLLWEPACVHGDCVVRLPGFDLAGNEVAVRATTASGNDVSLELVDAWWGSRDGQEIRDLVDDRVTPGAPADRTVTVAIAPWISGPPDEADLDDDGVLDRWDGDDDGDGVCDLQEARASRLDIVPPVFFSPVDATQAPANPDCDGDGALDADDPDDDDDGLVDAVEAGLGGSPLRPDTDADGAPDALEVEWSYDLSSPAAYPHDGRQHGSFGPENRNEAGQIVLLPVDGARGTPPVLTFAAGATVQASEGSPRWNAGLFVFDGTEAAPIRVRGRISFSRGTVRMEHVRYEARDGVYGSVSAVGAGSTVASFDGEALFLGPYGRLEDAVLRGGDVTFTAGDTLRGYAVVRDTVVEGGNQGVYSPPFGGDPGPITLERVVVRDQREAAQLPGGLLLDCEFTGSAQRAVTGSRSGNAKLVVVGGRYTGNAREAIFDAIRVTGAYLEANGAPNFPALSQVERVHGSTLVGNRGTAVSSPGHVASRVTASNLVGNAGFALDGNVTGVGNHIANNNGSDAVDLSEGDQSDDDQWRSASVTDARPEPVSAAPSLP